MKARNIFATFFLSSNSSERRLLYSDNKKHASSTIPDNLLALSLSETDGTRMRPDITYNPYHSQKLIYIYYKNIYSNKFYIKQEMHLNLK